MTLISDAGAKKVQRVFDEIQAYEAGLRIAFDGGFKELKWPLKIIACRGRKTLESLAPERERGEKNLAGYYQRGLGFDLIVINTASDRKELRRIVFHEFTHRMLDSFGYLPLWLDEGYASVFEQFTIEKGKIKFGLGSQYFVNFLSQNDVMSLDRLFTANHSSDEYNKERYSTSFYATSWAFVHMCMFERGGEFQKPFYAYTEAIKSEPQTEELFVDYFGVSYREMEKRIKRYASRGKYTYRIIDLSEEIDVPSLEFEEISPFDQNIHLASVLTGSRRWDEARRNLLRCQYAIPPLTEESDAIVRQKHAQLATGFALLEVVEGNEDVAHDYAETAVELDSESPAALMIHAKAIIGLKTGLYMPNNLDAGDLNEVLEIIKKVLGYGLDNKMAHTIHSYAWKHTAIYPRESHLNGLVFACKLYPADKTIHYNLADLYQRIGRDADAVAVLRHYAMHTTSATSQEEAMKRAEDLESQT